MRHRSPIPPVEDREQPRSASDLTILRFCQVDQGQDVVRGVPERIDRVPA